MCENVVFDVEKASVSFTNRSVMTAIYWFLCAFFANGPRIYFARKRTGSEEEKR